jgi:adenosylmethionine-8-amino-7-oxononanoate aminotransferase
MLCHKDQVALHVYDNQLPAGGLPIGAVLLKQHVADAMAPGDHGSTFAGNPLVCAAAVATFDIIADTGFLAEVERKGELLRSKLRESLGSNEHVKVPSQADYAAAFHALVLGVPVRSYCAVLRTTCCT